MQNGGTDTMEIGKINVNAIHLKIVGTFIVGGDIDVTVLMPTIDMLWED